MKFSRFITKDDRIVIMGSWNDEICDKKIVEFPYNQFKEGSEKKAEFLARQFAVLMPKMDEKFKEEKEKVLEVEVIIRDGDAVISPIIPQSPSPLELEIKTISLREFRRYLVYPTRLVGKIKAKYVVRNGCWKFKELDTTGFTNEG